MQLDIGLTSGMQLEQIVELSQLAQKQGLNHVWIGDDISLSHDVFTVASIVLLKSPHMNVGIGITSPLIRNISTIARASVSLAEINGDNRFRLGLGVGGLQDLAKLGIGIKNPENLLRDATILLRGIWKGETLSFESENFTLKHFYAGYGLGHQIAILFGVRGPKLLKLSGEIADGAILSGPKTYLKKAINLVKSSVRKGKQPSRDFRFVAWVPTILVEKPRDVRFVKRTVAFVLADTPRKVLEMAELDSNKIEKIKRASQRYGIGKASRLITEDLIDEASIHGNAKQMCESFQSLERLGVQEVVFGPPYGSNPKSALAKLAHAWSG